MIKRIIQRPLLLFGIILLIVGAANFFFRNLIVPAAEIDCVPRDDSMTVRQMRTIKKNCETMRNKNSDAYNEMSTRQIQLNKENNKIRANIATYDNREKETEK